jgi:PIN domain nuclease of toxin-antitoxin system
MMKRPKRSGAGAKSAHLLDTSTLLWALGEPERLSARAGRLVEAGENVVSVASYWEVVIKTQKGLLSISDLGTWWRRATELTAARVLNIRPSHITALAALPMLHKDPFDRILVAQAKAEGLALVTNDGSIGAYPIRTLW